MSELITSDFQGHPCLAADSLRHLFRHQILPNEMRSLETKVAKVAKNQDAMAVLTEELKKKHGLVSPTTGEGEGEGPTVSQFGEGEGPTVSQFEGIVEGPTGFAMNREGDGEGPTVRQFEGIKNLNAVKISEVEIQRTKRIKICRSRSKEQKE
jgi:hypothetical protein